jgi:hypothetical protein
MQALEPQAQVGGVVTIPGEGVAAVEPVMDARCGTGENAVVVVLVDKIEAAGTTSAWLPPGPGCRSFGLAGLPAGLLVA